MAENQQDNSQERTEEATPKRRQEARDKADLARSKELNTSAVLLAGAGSMLLFGAQLTEGMSRVFSYSFTLSREQAFDTHMMAAFLGHTVMISWQTIFPVLLIIALAALLAPIALGGWVITPKPMAPKWDRMSPIAGFKRMFSMRALVELLKSIAKVLLVIGLTIVLLYAMMPNIVELGKQGVLPAMTQALSVVGWSTLALAAITILIAAVDVPYQLFEHSKKLKMTRQEVKDELKNTEGKPEVKSRIRQLQRDMSQRRMMSAVPEADVVITNPEHFAVALRYHSTNMGAPVLVAKGADLVAFKIREIATANDVPVVEAPPLARAVFYSTKLDEEIPSGLYVAVAQVLAYVFQLDRYRKGAAPKPGGLENLPIPEELRRDAEDQDDKD